MRAGRVLLLAMIFASGISGCDRTDGTEVPGAPAAVTSQMASMLPGSHLARIGSLVYQLEDSAATVAFGDTTGETEGEEEKVHSFYESSVRILTRAAEQDPTDGVAWYWLGIALSSRAYLGFGEWNLEDEEKAVVALERAVASLGQADPLRAEAVDALTRERESLNVLRARQ